MTKDAGFSLMEVLIALAITASLSSAGVVMMVQTLNASSAIDQRMESVREQIKSDNLLRADLSSVSHRLGIDQNQVLSAHGFIGAQSNDGTILMSFIRDGWDEASTVQTRGNLQRVEYLYIKDQLVRRAWVRPDPARQTPFIDRTLYAGIDALSIRYRNDGKWFDVWPAEIDGAHPDLIELNLTFSDDDILSLKYSVGLPS